MNDNYKTRPRVLLIAPLMFSYHESICESLKHLGFEPVWWNDKASASTIYKIALRLMPKITRLFMAHHFFSKIDKLSFDSIENILIVKGEGLNAQVVKHLRERQPRAKLVLYLWDSVRNTRGIWDILPLADAVATFDPVDARKYSWRYRPLFARNMALSNSERIQKDYDWCFIGTIHSDRYHIISRLRQGSGGASSSFVFAYFQSPLILGIRKLFDWTLWSAPKGTLSTSPMDPLDVASIIARSRAVLDVEHPNQSGLTMRTIETLLSGNKLITTNRHLLDSDLFDVSRVQLINRKEPWIEETFLGHSAKPISQQLRDRYTCEAWLKELLDI